MAAAAAAAAPAPVAITVPPAFKNLVSLLAGMFYSGQCPPAWWVDAADPKKDAPDPEHAMFQQEKKAAQLQREAKRKAQQDTTGLGVILLTALTEEQWVEEDDFARKLNLPPKMVRKAIRYLEQEQLLQREHRKESVRLRKQEREMQIKAGLRQAPGSKAAAAAAAGGDPAAAAAAAAAAGDDDEEAIVSKGHIISYCALDYPRIVDSVRWRLHTIRQRLKRDSAKKEQLQKYKCPNRQCGKVYDSMDVWQMVPRGMDGNTVKAELVCTICNTPVVMVLDEAGTQTGDLTAMRERKKKAKDMLESMSRVLKPLIDQLAAVESINAPDFLSYSTWLANQAAVKQRWDAMEAEKAKGGTVGSKRRAEPTFDHTTQVVVRIADSTTDGNAGTPAAAAAAAAAGLAAAGARPGSAAAAPRSNVLPPWLAKGPAAQQQQQAAKPIPPWLMSSHKAAAAAAGGMSSLQQQQQPGSSLGYSSGLGIKQDGSSSMGLKADPAGIKLEGVKAEPGFKADPGMKQEDDFDNDEWQDVPGTGTSSGVAGAAAAAGGMQSAAQQAAGDTMEDEDEEWEEV